MTSNRKVKSKSEMRYILLIHENWIRLEQSNRKIEQSNGNIEIRATRFYCFTFIVLFV